MITVNLPRSLYKNRPPMLQVTHRALEHLSEIISDLTGLPESDFYLLNNGKKFDPKTFTDGPIHIIPSLPGGKGGFGSMLRAIGAQIEKTTNREACRDLSGRRLRDINEERRLKNWLAQKEEREREAKERKRKKLERLLQEPKVEIKDEDYNQQRSMLTENISDSVELGLKVAISSSGIKRKSEEVPTTSKKPKKGLLFDMDLEIGSDAEISSSDDDEASGPSGSSSGNKNCSSISGNEDDNSGSAGTSGIGIAERNDCSASAGCSSKD